MFQLGDFYELFFDDAVTAANALNLTLTRRGRHQDADVPMCGVPVASAASHIARLAAIGHSVALADQQRTAGSAGFDRVITRVVTPATSLDEQSPVEPRHLIAIVRDKADCVWAAADIPRLIGRAGRCEISALIDTLGDMRPAEILAAPDIPLGALSALRVTGHPLSAAPIRGAKTNGLAHGQVAVDWLVSYVARIQGGRVAAAIQFVDAMVRAEMAIDIATRRALDLGGTGRAPLAALLDRTKTVMGARLHDARLSRPTRDMEAITSCQDAWSALINDDLLRTRTRALLASVPDIERATTRLLAGRPGSRDLCQVRTGLARAQAIAEAGHKGVAPSPALHLLLEMLNTALDETPSSSIRAGHDEKLDHARQLMSETRLVMAALQADLARTTSASTLKIRHHAQLGYLAEVSINQAAAVRACSGFVLRQGLATAARFSHPELTRLGDQTAQAAEDAATRETVLLAALGQAVAAEAASIMTLANTIAALDVAQSAATLAQEGVWCRPTITNDTDFVIKELRHPGIEANGPCVPNDCDLSAAQRLMLLTGPNMAGKSTYLRQNAIAVILAQSGLPVPASAARIGLVDALFSRIGASDDIARGRSTFMVEMLEVASILSSAGPHSFVIVDEIGRGTATQDGVAIAQAVLEALHDTIRCRGIFATHFLELGSACATLTGLQACAMRVRQTQGGIVFLHEVITGAASRAWGVHVASLAGVPGPVVARAAALLVAAERSRPATDLPLFAPLTAPPPMASDPPTDPLRNAVHALEPDQMRPRDALDAIYRLKSLLTD